MWEELQTEVDKLSEARPQKGHFFSRRGGYGHCPSWSLGK